jgi:hypothetical protein
VETGRRLGYRWIINEGRHEVGRHKGAHDYDDDHRPVIFSSGDGIDDIPTDERGYRASDYHFTALLMKEEKALFVRHLDGVACSGVAE